MNKIFEKLGVYDLVAVLLSGICISTFSIFVAQIVYNISFVADFLINETISFLVISYFLGLVFQETGFGIQNKLLHHNNVLLKEALKTADDSRTKITETEKKGLYSYIINELNLDLNNDNDNIIYNYCKFYVVKKCDTTRIDRDQSLAAMSRSLSLYFSLLTLVAFSTVFCQPTVLKTILVFVSAFLAILLYHRCIRFTKLRYTNILRTFYYQVVAKCSTEERNSIVKKQRTSSVIRIKIK